MVYDQYVLTALCWCLAQPCLPPTHIFTTLRTSIICWMWQAGWRGHTTYPSFIPSQWGTLWRKMFTEVAPVWNDWSVQRYFLNLHNQFCSPMLSFGRLMVPLMQFKDETLQLFSFSARQKLTFGHGPCLRIQMRKFTLVGRERCTQL